MPSYQRYGVLYQFVSFLIMIATTVKAAHWQVEVANSELTKLKDDIPIHSSDDSKDPYVEKEEELEKSGTAWVRTYHKPPGTDVATIYNSDISRTDNWDPVKNMQLPNSIAQEASRFSITQRPAASVKYGAKTNVVTPVASSNAQLTNYQKIGSTETSYSTLVTSDEVKDKNRKDIVWTPRNKNRDWSLKVTAIQDGHQVIGDYDSSSIQNDTTSAKQMVERRETTKGSSAEYNDQSEASIEVIKGDPQDWRVVNEDRTDGWKILGRNGNIEWQIKLENGSWIVKNQNGIFSHKVDVATPLNNSAHNYKNDYLADYENYYEDTAYDVPDTGDIYLLANYEDTWPEVTNIAIPEPWRPEDPHNSQEFLETWSQISSSTDKPGDQDGTTIITQAPITENKLMKTTIQPKLTTAAVPKMGSDVTNVPKYYNVEKYYNKNKGSTKSEINRYPTNEVRWTPLSEMSTPAATDINESMESKFNIPKPNKSDNIYLSNPSKNTIRDSNQDPRKTQGQWITGYGSQTWSAGTGKKDWDSANSTADNLRNKVSGWGTGYGTKVWRGNEWDSNVVWKTGHGQGLWNSGNGTGTFVFPSNTYYGVEKSQEKDNYKGTNFFPGTKVLPTQSKKNFMNADKSIVVMKEGGTSANANHQDMSNSQQEEWGDEKSEGGVVWQKEVKLPVSGSKWKNPDDTNVDGVNKKPRVKTNNAKTWAAKWSKTPLTVNGPDWKPSIVLSEKNGWKPSGTDTANWKILDGDKQSTNPETDQTSMEKPTIHFEPPKGNPNIAIENTQSYKLNNSQYWKIAPSSNKDDSWELYRDNNPLKSNWKTTGKNWGPPVFVWPEYKQEITTTTISPTSDLSEQVPTVTYSLEPNPIYIKWRKPTRQSFKWPIATPASEKWRKPTIIPNMITTAGSKTTTMTTPQTPTTSPKTLSKIPQIKYIWPIKTFGGKSWKPLNIISSPPCTDKETTIAPTISTTTTTIMGTTTELPMTTMSINDDKDKSNLEHPPIIIIKKIPGSKKIKLSNKGKGRPKFRPLPPNFNKWGNYKGQALKLSSDITTGYYKGTPFKSIKGTKFKKQKRVKVPKWMKSSYKGSAGPPKEWASMKPNYVKWVDSNPTMYQNLKPTSYAKPKPTWKDTFKRMFG